MTSIFRPATIQDETQISDLLGRVLSTDAGDPRLASRLFRWKYWEPRGDYSEPRSYVMERAGLIVAHVGLWPVVLRSHRVAGCGVHMIDWASDPHAPGAGVALLQRLVRSFAFVYAIGGSQMTMEILPKFGFRTVTEAWTWARPLRSWRQMLNHQERDWRLPARLARNAWWSNIPISATHDGWTAVETDVGGAEGEPEFRGERDGLFFRYLKQCPAANCLVFRIFENGREEGYFALTVIQKQARLLGVWLQHPSEANWRVALDLAQDAALRYTDACEIVARGATGTIQEAARSAGMRFRRREPVFLYTRDDNAEPLPLRFQIADNDSVFLAGWRPHFLT